MSDSQRRPSGRMDLSPLFPTSAPALEFSPILDMLVCTKDGIRAMSRIEQLQQSDREQVALFTGTFSVNAKG